MSDVEHDTFKGLGTTITPGSNAYRAFRGLGSMKGGKLRDTVPAFLGGGIAAGASMGIRSLVSPAESPTLYRYAPLAGAGAGAALGGLASWFTAGKGSSGISAALGSVVSAIVVGGALFAEDLRLAALQPADLTSHLAAIGSPVILPTTPSPATSGVSMMEINNRTRRPTNMGQITASSRSPDGRMMTTISGVNENAWGAQPYGGR
jgi:hypothetical protein